MGTLIVAEPTTKIKVEQKTENPVLKMFMTLQKSVNGLPCHLMIITRSSM